ncbi:MAG: SDR family NAD(P)-dependent oxidoreductase [Eubacteriales bacterium]|nr:SDR family NAD(P)-dependent oxidoreductase [Eubacteriales bacterium]
MGNKRISLVTGGTSGIGQATAVELASRGDYVLFTGRSTENAKKTLCKIYDRGGSGEFIPCDLSDPGQIEDMMDSISIRHHRLDVLVNSAGISNVHTMEEITEAEWDWMMTVNLKAPFFCCRHAFSFMKQQHYGRIVNVSSIAGQRGAFFSGIHYAASKGGLLAMTKCFALQGAEHGITVNAVSPGTVDTPMSRTEGIPADGIPLGRAASPEEVAHAICFLTSDDAGYITGETLDVNGGQLMR